MRINSLDYIGNTYGYLSVLKVEISKKDNQSYAVCQCVCGNIKNVLPYQLRKGAVVSCGCYKKEICKNMTKPTSQQNGNYIDGRSKHPLYGTWFQMITRCENPNSKHYNRYGGRGIKVCDDWHDFWKFVEWSNSVGGRPQGYTLDRIKNDGNYEPNNCRWANWRTQKTNTSTNVFLEYNGIRKTMIEWCEELNINYRTLNNRINRGWSVEKALSECISKNSHPSRHKILCQYTTKGELVAKYKNLSELPSEFNKKSVSYCANGNRKTNNGYIWKYEDE